MTPHWGNTVLFRSSQQLFGLCLGPLKGFLSCHGALQVPLTYIVRNFKETRTEVRRARHKGTRTLSKTTVTNLDCALVENALYYTDP